MSGLAATTRGTGPHAGQRLVIAGAPLERARLVLVMIHGRGGAPEDMIGLADHLSLPDLAVLAPQAAGHSWWPDSFLAPLEANEPGLSSGLSVISTLLEDVSEQGFDPERVGLVGFSQGACLAVEAAARLAGPFRAVVALSGGLVGTGDADGAPRADLYDRPAKTFAYEGRLPDVPVLLGCHERDPHIPLARVYESAEIMRGMGAKVDTLIIPGAGHSVVEQEATWLRGQLNIEG